MNVQANVNAPGPPSPDRASTGVGLIELVGAARQGDQAAWNALVLRYMTLVQSVTRQYRLSASDAEDVSQSVWLRLFENLAALREVRALPGWIKSTTRNEALRVLAARRRTDPTDPSVLAVLDRPGTDEGVDGDLLRRERDRAVADGLAELAPEHRRLLVLLHAEPQVSYQEISRTLGMPSGSIGPTRARCLAKLRNTEALRRFAESGDDRNDLQAA
jgi:RNA polymerase sigma factor (sigma-70 family)